MTVMTCLQDTTVIIIYLQMEIERSHAFILSKISLEAVSFEDNSPLLCQEGCTVTYTT